MASTVWAMLFVSLAEAVGILSENVRIAKAALDLSTVEGKEAGVAEAITKRSDARSRIATIAEEIAKIDPNLTPAQAHAKGLSSEEGHALRARYNELPVEERAPVSKGHWIETAEAAENRETHPAVVELRAKAQEIRKDAHGAGEKISEAEAFGRAVEKHPELKSAYYQERQRDLSTNE